MLPGHKPRSQSKLQSDKPRLAKLTPPRRSPTLPSRRWRPDVRGAIREARHGSSTDRRRARLPRRGAGLRPRQSACLDPREEHRRTTSFQGRLRRAGRASSPTRAGRSRTGRRHGAAPAGARSSSRSFSTRCSAETRPRRSPSASTWSARSSTPSARRRRRSASCRASSISATGGARASRSRAPGPISRACARARGATAIPGSFTARRPGRPWRNTPTGFSSSPAPTRRRRSRRAFPSSSST